MVPDLEPIREGLRRAGADAVWVHPGVDLRHLTGLAPLSMERPTALVILAGGGLRTTRRSGSPPSRSPAAPSAISRWR